MLARIGRDYYLENRSKVDIAAAYGISRFQVARLLEEARATGIVRIEIVFQPAVERVDPEKLQKHLGVRNLVIIPTGMDDRTTREALAKAAAAELMERTAEGAAVGISWSRTLDLAARHVNFLPPCDIVQLAGALPVPGSGNSMELIQNLGRHSGVRTWPLWAPLVLENAQTAQSLRDQPEIAQTLTRADALDVAVVAVGSWAPGQSTVFDRVDNQSRLEAARAGAVAECSGRLLDRSGRPVDTELDRRVLAVSLDQLRQARHVIAVVQGASRCDAVRATLAAGLISTLIIDEDLAAALADYPDAATNSHSRSRNGDKQ